MASSRYSGRRFVALLLKRQPGQGARIRPPNKTHSNQQISWLRPGLGLIEPVGNLLFFCGKKGKPSIRPPAAGMASVHELNGSIPHSLRPERSGLGQGTHGGLTIHYSRGRPRCVALRCVALSPNGTRPFSLARLLQVINYGYIEKLLERVPSVTELFPDQTRGEERDPPGKRDFSSAVSRLSLAPPECEESERESLDQDLFSLLLCLVQGP